VKHDTEVPDAPLTPVGQEIAEEIAVGERQDRRGRMLRTVTAFAVGAAVAAAAMAFVKVDTQEQADQVVGYLQEDLATVCAAAPAAALDAPAQEQCRRAEQGLPPAPGLEGEQGASGSDGADGRGIASTRIDEAGHLFITYTDGAVEDKGLVVGAAGGRGVDGPPGRGITNTALGEDGVLTLTYTDGATEAVGTVVGRDGVDGRGIVSTTAVDGQLQVTYTDGTIEFVGPLPAGPAGKDGAPGATGPAGPTCPPGTLLESRSVDPDGNPLTDNSETWYVCVATVPDGG